MMMKVVLSFCLLILLHIPAFAQKLVVNAYKPCKVWIMQEGDTLEGQFSWWSAWCTAQKEGKTFDTPHTFFLRPNRSYTLVVFHDSPFSDGFVLKGINLKRRQVKPLFFKKKNFVAWHNLDCK